jgi:putative flippase GtrA
MMPALKYLAAGILTTSLSYLTFLTLYWGTSSVALSLVSANITGLCSSFILNRFWVWKLGEKKAILKFLLIQICAITINWLILHLISLTIFPRATAQLIIYAIFALVFYHLNKKYIFTNS